MGRSICQVQLAVPKAKPNSKAKTGFPPAKLMGHDERGEESSWLSLHPPEPSPLSMFTKATESNTAAELESTTEMDNKVPEKTPVPTGQRFFQKMKNSKSTSVYV